MAERGGAVMFPGREDSAAEAAPALAPEAGPRRTFSQSEQNGPIASGIGRFPGPMFPASEHVGRKKHAEDRSVQARAHADDENRNEFRARQVSESGLCFGRPMSRHGRDGT